MVCVKRAGFELTGAAVLAIGLGLGACSSGSSSPGATAQDGSTADTGPGRATSGSDGSTPEASSAEGGAVADAGCTTLTVMNYDAWCSISVAGATASTASSQTVCVAAGSVSLVAEPASSTYELGPTPWHDTSGDTGSGDPGTVTGSGATAMSATTVDVSGAAACVWACCPFTNGGGCPTTNQCP